MPEGSRRYYLARYKYTDHTAWGVVEGEWVYPLTTDFAVLADMVMRNGAVISDEILGARAEKRIPLTAVQLLAPVTPSKAVCVGLNYRDHAAELNHELPAEPVLFLKPSTAVIGPGQPVVMPRLSQRVDYEAELAVVIGRVARHVPVERAPEYILGYTCANDVTARDIQRRDGQWTRAKSFDTFLPLGPYIVTGIDPGHQTVELFLNGERRQHSNTAQLIFNVPTLISFISEVMTLLPGDVILTGTPAGVGPVTEGDIMEVRIGDIGSLVNPVVAER